MGQWKVKSAEERHKFTGTCFSIMELRDLRLNLSMCGLLPKFDELMKMCLMCSNDNFHSEDVKMKSKAWVKLVTFTHSSRSLHYRPSRKMRFLWTSIEISAKQQIIERFLLWKKSPNILRKMSYIIEKIDFCVLIRWISRWGRSELT